MFYHETSRYHTIKIVDIFCKDKGCEIEVFDFLRYKERSITLEESMCGN